MTSGFLGSYGQGLLVLAVSLTLLAPALAVELPDGRSTEDEDDLREWLADGSLDQASYQRLLVELHDHATALTRASEGAWTGQLRYRSLVLWSDWRMPPQALELQTAWRQFEGGLALLASREQIGAAAYDPLRQALTATPAKPQVLAPEYYLAWRSERADVVAGSYRLGFGQRLTFDNSGRMAPAGLSLGLQLTRSSEASLLCRESAGDLETSPCAGQASDRYGAPDFDHSQPLRGLAATITWPLNGQVTFDSAAFASLQSRDAYQYTLYNREQCANPRGEDEECVAPRVYVSRQPATAPAAAHAYQTLPQLWNEALAGGCLSIRLADRGQLSVIGWGAQKHWRPRGIAVDHQEWDRYPQGAAYGAVGIDGKLSAGNSTLASELTRSFDQIAGSGGGWGNYSAWSWSSKNQRLEVAARYYGQDFANPYARPPAAADEFEGNRARDEAGVRAEYYRRVGAWQSTVGVDPWLRLTTRRANLKTYWQQSYRFLKQLEPNLGLGFEDRDLGYASGNTCPDGVSDADPLPCGGQRWQLEPGLGAQPWRESSLQLRYRHDWRQIDVDQRQQDRLIAVRLAQRWRETWQMAWSTRYHDSDTANDNRSERWLMQRFGLSCKINDYIDVAGDYLLRDWLDNRDSTQTRQPNPEHWLLLDIGAAF